MYFIGYLRWQEDPLTIMQWYVLLDQYSNEILQNVARISIVQRMDLVHIEYKNKVNGY